MIKNITYQDLGTMSPNDIADMPPDSLYDLTNELEKASDCIKECQKNLSAGLDIRYAAVARYYRTNECKDAGTVRFMDKDFEIVANLPKKIEWDQKQFDGIVRAIEDIGENPNDYIKITCSVSETKYKMFPKRIRDILKPARTFNVGKPTYKIEPSSKEQKYQMEFAAMRGFKIINLFHNL